MRIGIRTHPSSQSTRKRLAALRVHDMVMNLASMWDRRMPGKLKPPGRTLLPQLHTRSNCVIKKAPGKFHSTRRSGEFFQDLMTTEGIIDHLHRLNIKHRVKYSGQLRLGRIALRG